MMNACSHRPHAQLNARSYVPHVLHLVCAARQVCQLSWDAQVRLHLPTCTWHFTGDGSFQIADLTL